MRAGCPNVRHHCRRAAVLGQMPATAESDRRARWQLVCGSAELAHDGPGRVRTLRRVGELEVVPVDADRADALGRLFVTSRSTRHCRCTAFCSSSWQFALGWYGGGNRLRFEAMASSD